MRCSSRLISHDPIRDSMKLKFLLNRSSPVTSARDLNTSINTKGGLTGRGPTLKSRMRRRRAEVDIAAGYGTGDYREELSGDKEQRTEDADADEGCRPK